MNGHYEGVSDELLEVIAIKLWQHRFKEDQRGEWGNSVVRPWILREAELMIAAIYDAGSKIVPA